MNGLCYFQLHQTLCHQRLITSRETASKLWDHSQRLVLDVITLHVIRTTDLPGIMYNLNSSLCVLCGLWDCKKIDFHSSVHISSLLLHPSRGAEYCDQFVCVSLCLRAYLWNRWTDPHKILCADPLWPWLGPPPAALCTSGFMDDVMFGRNGPYGASGGQIPGWSLMSVNALFVTDV